MVTYCSFFSVDDPTVPSILSGLLPVPELTESEPLVRRDAECMWRMCLASEGIITVVNRHNKAKWTSCLFVLIGCDEFLQTADAVERAATCRWENATLVIPWRGIWRLQLALCTVPVPWGLWMAPDWAQRDGSESRLAAKGSGETWAAARGHDEGSANVILRESVTNEYCNADSSTAGVDRPLQQQRIQHCDSKAAVLQSMSESATHAETLSLNAPFVSHIITIFRSCTGCVPM